MVNKAKKIKKGGKLFCFIALFVLAVCPSFAATTTGTATVTAGQSGALHYANISWTSSNLGNVVNNDAIVTGEIVKVVFDPGSTAPSDNWDCTITDGNGNDLLLGSGANHDTANTETVSFGNCAASSAFSPTTVTQTVNTLNTYLPWRVFAIGAVSVNITNAGSAKTGAIKIYWREVSAE